LEKVTNNFILLRALVISKARPFKYSTDVKVFDKKLFSLIDNPKDTINENNFLFHVT